MDDEQTILMSPQDANLLRDVIRALRNVRGAGGIQVHFTGSGMVVALRSPTPLRPAGANASLVEYRVIEEKEDYLRCRLAGDIGEPGIDPDRDVSVMKPDHLRGFIAERTVNEGTIAENTQFIYPQYLPYWLEQEGQDPTVLGGESVFAIALDESAGFKDDDEKPILLQDFNFPTNRQWVMECLDVSA